MIIDINSKLWKEVYLRISSSDEKLMLAFFENGKYGMSIHLKEQYDIEILSDLGGRWKSIRFKDIDTITMILLKYPGEIQ